MTLAFAFPIPPSLKRMGSVPSEVPVADHLDWIQAACETTLPEYLFACFGLSARNLGPGTAELYVAKSRKTGTSEAGAEANSMPPVRVERANRRLYTFRSERASGRIQVKDNYWVAVHLNLSGTWELLAKLGGYGNDKLTKSVVTGITNFVAHPFCRIFARQIIHSHYLTFIGEVGYRDMMYRQKLPVHSPFEPRAGPALGFRVGARIPVSVS